MSKKETTSAADVNSADYKNLVDLLGVFTEAKLRLDELQNTSASDYLEIVDGVRKDYAELQSKVTESELAIEIIAMRHPEWFTEKRSVKTPYGTVKVTRTNKLDVPNEEVSILLIERAEELGTLEKGRYLRTKKEVNIDALQSMTDAELSALRINRIRDESVKVTEAKVDFGKAVKSIAAKSEVAA